MTKQCPANWKWCFTFNNYTEVDIIDLVDVFSNAKDIMYFFREEIGEQDTPHLQGVVWCTRRTSKGRRAAFRPFTLTKNKRIHWEPLKSSVQQHVDYCGGTGDHSEKSGTGGDVYTNITPMWESVSMREERALKVAEEQQQQMEQRAEQEYDDMKPYIAMIRNNDVCSELWRQGHIIVDKYMDEHYHMFWEVLSGGECKNIEEWMVWERQWLDVWLGRRRLIAQKHLPPLLLRNGSTHSPGGSLRRPYSPPSLPPMSLCYETRKGGGLRYGFKGS